MNKKANSPQDFWIQNFRNLSKNIREGLPKSDLESWQKQSLIQKIMSCQINVTRIAKDEIDY